MSTRELHGGDGDTAVTAEAHSIGNNINLEYCGTGSCGDFKRWILR